MIQNSLAPEIDNQSSAGDTNSSSAKIDDEGRMMTTDSLSIMLDKEQTTYSCHDYLMVNSSCNDEDCINFCCSETDVIDSDSYHCCNHCNERSKLITPKDRTKIVDWCYDIVDRCHFKRECVAMAMSMVDHFASSISFTSSEAEYDSIILQNPEQYQLVAVTALYISIKISERMTFSSHDFADVSHGMYTTEDIEWMECELLFRLEWRISAPVPLQIGYHILEWMEQRATSLTQDSTRRTTISCSTWDFLRDELAYQTENAVCEYYFTTQHSSVVAVASLLNAMSQVNDSDEYQVLVRDLTSILNRMDFDEISSSTLAEAQIRLSALIDDDEEDEEGEEDTSTRSASRHHLQEQRQDDTHYPPSDVNELVDNTTRAMCRSTLTDHIDTPNIHQEIERRLLQEESPSPSSVLSVHDCLPALEPGLANLDNDNGDDSSCVTVYRPIDNFSQ